MNLDKCIGCAVTVILREGRYHGTIHRLDNVDKRITLQDVYDPVTGKRYPGFRHFYVVEILDMVFDDDNELPTEEISCNKMNDLGPTYSKAKTTKPLSDENQEKQVQIETKSFDYPLAKSCDEFTIVDDFNENLKTTVDYIKKQSIIGLHIESVGEGRHGTICWISVAVKIHVYIFDFTSLGNDLFNLGLRDILENQAIIKVIHDCRFMSDLLSHKYSLNLVNVFDTQVADAFVHRIWYGVGHKDVWPKYVQALSACLYGHLKLNAEEISCIRARESRTKGDQEFWIQHPLTVPLAKTLVSSVIHLQELHHLLLEKMMVEYLAAVDIYLSVVRDLDDSEVLWALNKKEILPKSFWNMNKFTHVIKESFKNKESNQASDLSWFKQSEDNKRVEEKVSLSVKNYSSATTHSSECKPERRKAINLQASDCVVDKKYISDNRNDDILIQTAKKIFTKDLSSDVLKLLEIPSQVPIQQITKSQQHMKDSKLDIIHQSNLCNQKDISSIDWSKYKGKDPNYGNLNLLPAGYNMIQKKMKNNHAENKKINPQDNQTNLSVKVISNSSINSEQTEVDILDEITDNFLEIPERENIVNCCYESY